jgi:hypothetical protein
MEVSMKKIALNIFAGAFGMLMLMPVAQAQTYSIEHDRQELRHDLRRGDVNDAWREKREIRQKQRNYYYNRQPYSYYYRPYGYAAPEYSYNYYRHHHHHAWRDDD